MDERERDEQENNILAAGGVFIALHQAGLNPEIVTDESGTVTNMIAVSLHWMKSRYRITVERIPGEEEE